MTDDIVHSTQLLYQGCKSGYLGQFAVQNIETLLYVISNTSASVSKYCALKVHQHFSLFQPIFLFWSTPGDQSLRYFTVLFGLFFLYSKCRRGEKISGTSLSAQFDECVSILLRPEEISRICDSADGREISASQCDKFVRESLPKKATGNFSSSYGPVLFFFVP